jgi:hypothetical protein
MQSSQHDSNLATKTQPKWARRRLLAAAAEGTRSGSTHATSNHNHNIIILLPSHPVISYYLESYLYY